MTAKTAKIAQRPDLRRYPCTFLQVNTRMFGSHARHQPEMPWDGGMLD
jgi:hypothetical protein